MYPSIIEKAKAFFKRNAQVIVRFVLTLVAFGLVAAFVKTFSDWLMAAVVWLFVDRMVALIKARV